jgi:endonuclease-3
MPKPSAQLLKRQDRVLALLPILHATYPGAKCSLDFTNPLELLVATVLSAQCTDERVNLTTPALFKRYRSTRDYAAADLADLGKAIQSCGFFNQKAKSLKNAAAAIVEKHGGAVPRTMEELTKLPGVGRKTANVVLGNAYGINVGVTVDTHVSRVSKRLGLTSHDDPVKIEQDLMKIVPQEQWCQWSHLLIHHGRAICKAPRPLCEQCPLLAHCPTGPKVLRERARATPRRRK